MASNELDSFISGLDDQDKSEVVANPKQETDKGQYYVDQTTGQYYYQSENNESIAVAGLPGEEQTEVTSNNTTNDSNNQVVLNTGGDQYQTVTIVPSDGNTGEVSYVLIVQQPEDKDKQSEEAIGVYDFENEGDFDDDDPDDAIDDKDVGEVLVPRPVCPGQPDVDAETHEDEGEGCPRVEQELVHGEALLLGPRHRLIHLQTGEESGHDPQEVGDAPHDLLQVLVQVGVRGGVLGARHLEEDPERHEVDDEDEEPGQRAAAGVGPVHLLEECLHAGPSVELETNLHED